MTFHSHKIASCTDYEKTLSLYNQNTYKMTGQRDWMTENKPGIDSIAEGKDHQGRILNHVLTQMDIMAHLDA